MSAASVLVVDDEPNILTTTARALKLEGYTVEVAGSVDVAVEKLDQAQFDVALVDVQMPGKDGLEMLDLIAKRESDLAVIMMSGHATVEVAVAATKRGAIDFLEKPVGSDRLLLSIRNALRLRSLEHENRELRRREGGPSALLGDSAPMERLRGEIALAASAQAPVLILGERGTGKELVATAVHEQSPRTDGPFEKLNCAAVPDTLIESELFGHEPGAFTGATKRREGKFERADGGTLFLDEVGDMPSQMQAKLLRALQEGEIERVGGGGAIRVNVRVVAATNKSLPDEIAEGRFRADLHDRLNVVPLRVPPLRERVSDIEDLGRVFFALACEVHQRPDKTLDPAALAALAEHDFPGNVRELKNLVERLVILTPGKTIGAKDVARALAGAMGGAQSDYYRPSTPLREMLEAAERDLILRALDQHDGHVTNTAADLGLERSHLYKKMRALGLRKQEDSRG